MNCKKCNTELPEGSTTCPLCGADVETEEASKEKNMTAPSDRAEANAGTEEGGKETADEMAGGSADAQEKPAGTEEYSAGKAEGDSRESGSEGGATEQPAAGPGYSPLMEPERKSKGAAKFIIGGAVVAVAAIICVVAALAGRKDPKTVVIDAFKSVYTDDTVRPAEEIFGFGELMKNEEKASRESSVELMIEEVALPELSILNGSGFSFLVQGDLEKNLYNMDLGVQYAGMDAFNARIYADDTYLKAAIPGLSEKVFTVDYADDLGGQIEKSPFLGPVMESQGMDLSVLSDLIDDAKDGGGQTELDFKGLWERYKEGSRAIDDLKEAMTVEKTDKKKFTVDGKEVKCQGYKATIAKDDLIDFVDTTSEFFIEDETFKEDFLNYMSQTMEISKNLYGYSMYGDSAEEFQSNAWEMARDAVDEMIKAMEESMDDEIVMDLYVDKKGRLINFDSATTLALEDGTDLDMNLQVSLEGGAYLTQNGTLKLSITDGEDTVEFNMEKTGTYEKGKSLTCGLDMDVSIDDEVFTLGYAGDYDVKTGDYEVDFTGGYDSLTVFEVNATGVISNLTKGKSIDISIDSMDVIVNNDKVATLSGSFAVKPLEDEITPPEGEEMDVIAATREDWMDVVNEIQINLYSLMMKMQF